MTPQTMDLIVALQEALEELGLMKEAAKLASRAALVREEGTSQTLMDGSRDGSYRRVRPTFGRRGLVVKRSDA